MYRPAWSGSRHCSMLTTLGVPSGCTVGSRSLKALWASLIIAGAISTPLVLSPNRLISNTNYPVPQPRSVASAVPAPSSLAATISLIAISVRILPVAYIAGTFGSHRRQRFPVHSLPSEFFFEFVAFADPFVGSFLTNGRARSPRHIRVIAPWSVVGVWP